MQDSLRHSMPLAVVEARRVGWANPCAHEAGIVVGMPDTAASTRRADLTLLARDLPAEAAAVIEAALWALHFTPQVNLQDMGLLLEVSGSLRLFGGIEALTLRVREGVEALGFTPQTASAPTATAAWMLARYRDGVKAGQEDFAARLERLPVWLLTTAGPHLDTLQAVGCQSIAELRRLPRQGITRRFGKDMLTELDRAFGSEPELLGWYEPDETFSARMELGARVETTEALLHVARRMLMQMTGWLVARHSAVRQFSLLLHHETLRYREHKTTTLPITLGSASRDLAHLSLLLQEHLAKVDLSASVIEVSLVAEQIELLAAPNTELFPTPVSQTEAMVRLVERLASRLGEKAISRLGIVGDHRPERCSVALGPDVKPARTSIPGSAFAARPGWLLATPVALLIREHRPFYQGVLTILAGPERIEGGWWDDGLVTRDYFVACNEGNLVLWVYRERVLAGAGEDGWFLHGYFG